MKRETDVLKFSCGKDCSANLPLYLLTGLLMLAGLYLQWTAHDFFHNGDLRIQDALDSVRNLGTVEHVVVVDIDDLTLDSTGQWPWPRYAIGALIEQIQAAQPELIVADILFPEEDRTSPVVLKKRYRQDFNLDLKISGLPSGMESNDAYLGATLQDFPTVGALFFLHDLANTESVSLAKLALPVHDADLLSELPQASGVLRSVPEISNGYASEGFINTVKDSDGTLRRFSLLYRQKDALYPHLMLAALIRLLHVQQGTVTPTLTGFSLKLENKDGKNVLDIPVNRDGSTLLRFDAGTPPVISALDILRSTTPDKRLKGKTVILGASAAGLNDLHHTPAAGLTPGASIQGTFLEQALLGKFAISPDWGNTYAGLLTLVLCLLVISCFVVASPLWAVLGSLCLPLCVAIGTAGASAMMSIQLPVAGPLGTWLLVTLGAWGTAYVREHQALVDNLHAVIRTRQLTLESMAATAEMRSMDGDEHIRRTQCYVRILAEYLLKTGQFPQITPDYVELLCHSAPLHDLGKVAIPDAVLFKPGRLTPDEFAVMKKHTTFGGQAIKRAAQKLDQDHFLQLAAEIATTHHERWDGTGYPAGLKGEAIPLSGRIMALADVYDALISKRVYKDSFPHEKARAIIVEGRGTHFDPRIVDAFLATENEFLYYAKALSKQDLRTEEILAQ